MLSSIAEMRLQQLEKNVMQVMSLLSEYERELSFGPDPGTKSKYRYRIQDLREQQASYEQELVIIQGQLAGDQQENGKISTIDNQLQQLGHKIDWLVDGQAGLYQALLSYFNTNDQAVIDPVARQLPESQLIEVQSILQLVESGQISEEEINNIVAQVKPALASLSMQGINLPNDNNEALVEAINYPTLDNKHALKLSIPIIPFILSYEGELGIGGGIKIRETWDRWKARLRNR